MICHLCGKDKLSDEFPDEHLTEECVRQHALLHCLRCVTRSVRDHQKCSQCDVQVTEDNMKYGEYVQTLKFLFPSVASGDEVNTGIQSLSPTTDDPTSYLVITTLSGESVTLPYNADQTIAHLKNVVEQELKAPFNKQSLLYNGIELKTRGQNNAVLKLKDHNVQPNSRIYLLVLLYAIPDEFDDVIFDLFWGYPDSLLLTSANYGRDYLDASVLLYSGSKFVDVIDFSNKSSKLCSGVEHSGDRMDDTKRLGHHTIDVSIKSLPTHIDKLVFILSAWRSPNISKFRNPSLRFFDAKFPDVQLCSDEMSEVADSQAIIMCCLTNKENVWQVFSLKHLSAGNALNYEPLKRNIVSLIAKGYI